MSGPFGASRRDERFAILICVVVLAVLLSALVALPSRALAFDLFGSELTLRFTGSIQVLLLVELMVCVGVDALVRRPLGAGARPSLSLPYAATFYSLPAMLTVVGLVAVHSLSWWGYQLAASLLFGGALALVISMQLATRTLESHSARAMRLILNGLAYLLALGLFGLIFGARLRSLLSGTGILVASGLIGLELYRSGDIPTPRIWLYAGLTALLMGELTWALNYTALDTSTASALLLLAFYAITGITQQTLWDRLTYRVIGEYAFVVIAGVIAITILL